MANDIQETGQTPEVAFSQSSSGQGVGQLLRETRERMGHSLPMVASALRIRQPYLQAIETGQFQDLPGSAYAVGFVRSYAEYLGLDGIEIVRRFKLEAEGFSNRAELSFPTTVSEASFPTGGLLFIGVAAAVIIYGIWYWSTRDAPVAETVPPLPDRLAALIHKPVGNGSEVVSATGQGSGGASTGAPQQTPATPADGQSAPVPATTAAPATTPSHEDVVPPNEGEGNSSAAPAASVPAVAPTPAVMTPAQSQAPQSQAPQSQSVPTQSAPASSALAPSAAAQQQPSGLPTPPSEDVQIASGKATQPVTLPDAPRIILKTNEDVWIYIRGVYGNVIHTGILRKGTSFRVSNRPGQVVLSSNAAAMTVIVDNRQAPSEGRERKSSSSSQGGASSDSARLNNRQTGGDAAPTVAPAQGTGGAE